MFLNFSYQLHFFMSNSSICRKNKACLLSFAGYTNARFVGSSKWPAFSSAGGNGSFYLDYVNAADSLEKITLDSSYKNKQEKINILSNVYVYTNDIEKIKNLLAEGNINEEDKLYLKFNLAIAYLKNNDMEKGKQQLLYIANLKPVNIEQATISDKAKLHLANLSFKDKDYKKTITYIESMGAV